VALVLIALSPATFENAKQLLNADPRFTELRVDPGLEKPFAAETWQEARIDIGICGICQLSSSRSE
jgi:hypothetical protein